MSGAYVAQPPAKVVTKPGTQPPADADVVTQFTQTVDESNETFAAPDYNTPDLWEGQDFPGAPLNPYGYFLNVDATNYGGGTLDVMLQLGKNV